VKLFDAVGDSNSQKLREREIREEFVCLLNEKKNKEKKNTNLSERNNVQFGLRAFSHCLGHEMHTRTITQHRSSETTPSHFLKSFSKQIVTLVL